MQQLWQKFKYFDWPLMAACFLLLLGGLAILYGTTMSESSHTIFYRQLIFVSSGIAGYVFISFFDYHTLAKTNRVLYVALILILLYLLVFGAIVRGGKRWLDFGLLNLQPAEFAKLSVILGLAQLLYLRRGQINSWKIIGWSFLYALVPAALIIKEPDLGSALVILGIWAGVLLISRAKRRYLAILLIVFLAATGIAWKFFLKDFQKSRIEVFFDPSLDPRGRGYNVKQATIAVGSGQLLGRGLGKGVQSQRKFLPERQTDFIFAASSEEIGFLGSASLLGLYLFLLLRVVKIAKSAKDDLGMYIASGVFFLLLIHISVNIGMNIGLLPVTGIPLPFVSAGGSSLIVCLLALGVVQNIAMESKILRF